MIVAQEVGNEAKETLVMAAKRFRKALVGNDVDALIAMYCEDPRYREMGLRSEVEGQVSEALHSMTSFRSTVTQEKVFLIGDSFGLVTLTMERRCGKSVVSGVLSQFWLRFPSEGWRVISESFAPSEPFI